MQYLHAVAYAFDLRQDVRRQDHAAVAAEFADKLADFADLVGVEPDRRFVEYHDVGTVHDRLRNADALLIALGQRADQFIRDIGKTAIRERVVDRRAARGFGHAMQPRGEVDVLLYRQFAVQRWCFRQITDARFRGDRLVEQIDAANADRAQGRREIAGQHLHGGRFAGAVGAEKAEDLAAFQLEAHAVDRGMQAEFSGKPLGGNSNLGG